LWFEKSILTSEEQNIAVLFHQRFERLCEMAAYYKVKLLIDAEEYCFQDLIDEKCESMMRKYNTSEVIIYNTLQMYRHDRENYLERLIKRAKNENFKIGLKVVRGAYLEKENERALKNNYPTPIHASKAETDKSYDNAVQSIVENIDVCELFLGTHNRKSIELLIALMGKNGISSSDKRIFIGQLYGMSDNLTFNLASNQYNVAKYLPYGPVKETIPYLIRRAQENTAVAGETSRELLLIKKEIARRKQ
jgi:proline dehydrogenase